MSLSADEPSAGAGTLAPRGGAVENGELAALLDRLADLLEIEGANRFRVRAYRAAARTVRDLPGNIAALVAEGRDLAELPGIGRDLAEKLVGIVESGRFPALEEARARVPAGLVDLLELPGLGPKRAKALYDELGITTLDELAHGPTRSTVRLRSGLQVDLRVVGEESYGAALCYFTGSVAHSVAVRRLAQRAGLKLNEYGVFRDDERLGGRNEREVFGLLGLPYIAPELRENRGDVEAALGHRLPHLVQQRQIRGDLRVHRSAGERHGLRGLANAVLERGYEYVAIADRTQAAGGPDQRHLREQLEDIERLDDELEGHPVLLKAAEVEIREDGSLDLPERLLRRLDLTICAVHTRLDLSRRRQTQRVLKAIESPYCTILAHPTGRRVSESSGYELDLERVIDFVHERACFLELDARPERLDLNDVNCELAKARGARVALASGASTRAELDFLRFGVDQARRGWLEPADVLNTRPIAELRRLIARS